MNTTNITINTQSSIRIAGSKILYFDPFRIMAEPHDADIIFITHSHHDHLDPESVEKFARENTVFVAPSSMGQEMQTFSGSMSIRRFRWRQNSDTCRRTGITSACIRGIRNVIVWIRRG